MLKNLKLSHKFNILLIVVFLAGTILAGSSLAALLNYSSQQEITSKALVLQDTILSVRDYTENQVRPELEQQAKTEFLPQTVPSYSAREVFEKFRQNPNYREFFYKEATLNPTNLRDKADNFETQIVEQFRNQTNLKELSGFRSGPSGELFYIARPLAVTEASCLECHSTPERAPESMISRYGKSNGFGWKLNEIIGAQVIYVPAQKVFQRAHQSFVLVMGIIVIVFAIAIFSVNFWLNRYVVLPLKQISQVAEIVSTGDMNVEFEHQSNDEVGVLAEAFTRMKTSLALAMKRLEKYRGSS
ncbi:MAG: DUF3365 domain-containing protein [Microcoleaceae cyanobacterium]